MTFRWKRGAGALALSLLCATFSSSSASAEDKPSVIRIAFPGVGVGNRPVSGGSALASANLRGVFEEEFKKDGIKIQWSFLRGAGPAVNELYANELIDFSTLGDLPSVIGKASGLKYKQLAVSSVRSNIYVGVPADSSIQSVKDLKGKRIAVNKGTSTHLAGLKILEQHGLTEKDVKLINMQTNAAQLAIATRDIDALFGGSDTLRIRDQGIARVVFTTRGAAPALTSNSSFLGRDEFIKKYPEITNRVLKVYLQATKWQTEANQTQLFQLWTKSGTTFSSYREDLQGEDMKYRYSPLIDDYIAARYRLQIEEAKRLGLIKQTFKYEDFAYTAPLARALEELGLAAYWQPRGLDGKPKAPEAQRAAAAGPPSAPAASVARSGT